MEDLIQYGESEGNLKEKTFFLMFKRSDLKVSGGKNEVVMLEGKEGSLCEVNVNRRELECVRCLITWQHLCLLNSERSVVVAIRSLNVRQCCMMICMCLF